MKVIIFLLLPVFCTAQVQKWDSSYLKHWVDSTGTLPPNVDLSTLHLSTDTKANFDFWQWADTVQPVGHEFYLKKKKRKK